MSGARRRAAALAVALLAVAAIASIGQASGAFTSSQARPIAGTDRAETLIGTPGPDTIRGRGGDDTIVGRAGGDRLLGGAGTDQLRGGRGSDRLVGQGNGAVMTGGEGRDEFNMRDGVQIQGAGRDVIRARDGRADEINCGRGDDVAYVDRVEDGIYDCERVVPPPGSAEPARGER